MSSQPPERDPRSIWQNQETEKTSMSVEDVRAKAEKFLSRNRRELIARSTFALSAAVFCGLVLTIDRLTPARVIAGLITAMLLVGTIRSLYLAFVRTRGIPGSALTACAEFYRNELERQRAMARQPAWQLLTALLIIGWLMRNAWYWSSANPVRPILLFVLFLAAGLILLMAFRKLEARGVQEEIEALDRFEEEKH
jgi:hypothetical protein